MKVSSVKQFEIVDGVESRRFEPGVLRMRQEILSAMDEQPDPISGDVYDFSVQSVFSRRGRSHLYDPRRRVAVPSEPAGRVPSVGSAIRSAQARISLPHPDKRRGRGCGPLRGKRKRIDSSYSERRWGSSMIQSITGTSMLFHRLWPAIVRLHLGHPPGFGGPKGSSAPRGDSLK